MSDLKHYQRVKYIDTYIHHNHSVGVLVEYICDTTIPSTDIVFQQHVQQTAMQIASGNPADVNALLDQYSIKNPDQRIKEILSELVESLGENIEIVRFVRWDTEVTHSDFEDNDPPPEASSAALRAVK